MYIEMGLFGFSAWLYYKFIQFNNFCWKHGNRKAYLMAVLSTMYLGLCYSTDNVSKYFLVSIPFWICPLAYALNADCTDGCPIILGEEKKEHAHETTSVCWKKTGALSVSCEDRLNGRYLADMQTCGCAQNKNSMPALAEMP